MSQLDLPAFEQQLLAMRKALLDQIALQRGGVVPRAGWLPTTTTTRKTRARNWPANGSWSLPWASANFAELTTIDQALARLEAGTYGECTDCGAAIAPARLHATLKRPVASTARKSTNTCSRWGTRHS